MYQKKINPQMFGKIKKIVPIPCYLAGKLCGTYKYEFTHASTTQLYDFNKNRWSPELCKQFDFSNILPEVVDSGTIIGKTGSGIDCILPATHDTASAYAAISTDLSDTLIISAGTWCLNGVITHKKELNREFILENNLAVEGCYDGLLRILSNTPGLVFWQKIRTELETVKNRKITYSELLQLALTQKDFNGIINVNREKYLLSDSILTLLKQDFQTDDIGKILTGTLNSLAHRIQQTKTVLEKGLNLKIKKVHMLGGGIQNTLLCEKICEYLKIDVYTGPIEGTAFGNAVVQFIAEHTIKSPEEKSPLLENSFEIIKYTKI
jgi:rhamnulokinase